MNEQEPDTRLPLQTKNEDREKHSSLHVLSRKILPGIRKRYKAVLLSPDARQKRNCFLSLCTLGVATTNLVK